MKRIISAAIGVPAIFVVVNYGTFLHFFILVSIVLIVGLIEFYGMMMRGGRPCFKEWGIICGWLISLSIFLGEFEKTASGERLIVYLTITMIIISVMIYRLFPMDGFKLTIEGLSNTLFGILYVGWLMSHLILLRGVHDGKILIFYVLIVTWVGDTTSLYVGTALGKHRLAPSISPNKTIEGAIGGLAGSLLSGFLAKLWFFERLSILDCIITSLLCGIIGQVGDLCESAIKRDLNEKDAGNIIPGHGGILDRMDGILFSAPALYYYVKIFL